MSWKMFGQMAILIVTAALVLTAAKVMKLGMCGMSKDKRTVAMQECVKNFNTSTQAQQ